MGAMNAYKHVLKISMLVSTVAIYTLIVSSIWPRREKSCLCSYRQCGTQTSLLSHKRLAKKMIFYIEARLDIILTKKRMTKALISLRGCAGWSMPLLFANPEDRFPRVERQLILEISFEIKSS